MRSRLVVAGALAMACAVADASKAFQMARECFPTDAPPQRRTKGGHKANARKAKKSKGRK